MDFSFILLCFGTGVRWNTGITDTEKTVNMTEALTVCVCVCVCMNYTANAMVKSFP